MKLSFTQLLAWLPLIFSVAGVCAITWYTTTDTVLTALSGWTAFWILEHKATSDVLTQ